mmetsp:Transcript_21158/g.63357  ORF Transcript_21158/g.63357 Transcript_21158/m.63357 type:complete len:461 (+) Transcript_21158:1360-2742(+)
MQQQAAAPLGHLVCHILQQQLLQLLQLRCLHTSVVQRSRRHLKLSPDVRLPVYVHHQLLPHVGDDDTRRLAVSAAEGDLSVACAHCQQQLLQVPNTDAANRVDGKVSVGLAHVRAHSLFAAGRDDRLEHGLARERTAAALGQHALLLCKVYVAVAGAVQLRYDRDGQRRQRSGGVGLDGGQRRRQVRTGLSPLAEGHGLRPHMLQVERIADEHAVTLQVGAALLERAVALLQLRADVRVRGARLAVLHDGDPQVDQVGCGVDHVVDDVLGAVALLQQPHYTAHAHIAACGERLLLRHLLRLHVPHSSWVTLVLLVAVVAPVHVLIAVAARAHALHDVGPQAVGLQHVDARQASGTRAVHCALAVHVQHRRDHHAHRRAPVAHLAVEDDGIVQPKLVDLVGELVEVLRARHLAVGNRHARVHDGKTLLSQTPVDLLGCLHRIWVVDLLPFVVQRSVRRWLK